MLPHLTRLALALTALGTAPLASAVSGPLDSATRLFTFQHASSGSFASEIVGFDAATATLWVTGVSGVDVLNARTGALIQRIDTSLFGSINSVSIHNGIAAFAIESAVRTDHGVVKLYDTTTRTPLAGINSITVGALPDMLGFTPDGSKLLVANEGTPSTYGPLTSAAGAFPRSYEPAALDPVGSLSIIDMATRTVVASPTFDSAPRSGSHIRTNTGMNFEPEYVTVNAAGTRAYVSLQEANAMGVVNLQTGTTEQVIGLGVKDFSAPGNRIDPLNNGNTTGTSGYNLASVNVKGLYMPDGMAAFRANGQTFVAMANEGDFREDDGDRSAASALGAVSPLNNLRVSNTDSSAGNLFAAGGRSFSIRREDGTLVYDSGEILDREAMALGIYNDSRSRDKGVEPEGIEIVDIGGRTFAFVGLERTAYNNSDTTVANRVAAVAIFDVTDPANSSFVRMLKTDGDMAPEGLKAYTLDGFHYLAYSNEVSNTTTVYQLAAVPEPGTWATLAAGLGALAAIARRRRPAH